jgi:hypothetical protein
MSYSLFCKESAPWRENSKEGVNRRGEGKSQGKTRGRPGDEFGIVILIMQHKWSDFRKLRGRCVSRARAHILLFRS